MNISRNSSGHQPLRVLLVFNSPEDFSGVFYQSMSNTLGQTAQTEVFIYALRSDSFSKLMMGKAAAYQYVVLAPMYNGANEDLMQLMNQLPPGKLILIDKHIPNLPRHFPCVYQDFEADIYTALSSARCYLRKYDSLQLISPEDRYFPLGISDGFSRFCRDFGFRASIESDIDIPVQGTLYLLLSEEHLVKLIKLCNQLQLIPGRHVGILSYNDYSYKEILGGGISVLTTDRRKMGETAAAFILGKSGASQVHNPFRLIVRNSL